MPSTTRKVLIAACATAAVATGCGAGPDTTARATDRSPAGAAPSAAGGTPSAASTPAASRPAPASPSTSPPGDGAARRWADSTQFLEVREARTRDGVLLLTVRPARKRVLGESFETVPVPGPYTEVTVHEHARIVTVAGTPRAHEAFPVDLAARTARQRGEAFDVTFDDQGRVFEVEWLYVP